MILKLYGSRLNEHSSLLLLPLCLLRHSRKPVQKESAANVKDDESPHDAEVTPAVGVAGTERSQVGIRVGHGAEFASLGGIWVQDSPTCLADIALQIFPAGLAARGIEDRELDRGASNDVIGKTSGKHSIDKVIEG